MQYGFLVGCERRTDIQLYRGQNAVPEKQVIFPAGRWTIYALDGAHCKATQDPMAAIEKIDVSRHVKVKWRDLSVEESAVLLQATEGQPFRHDMTGAERALLYKLALESGLRRKSFTVLRYGISI